MLQDVGVLLEIEFVVCCERERKKVKNMNNPKKE